MLLFGVLTPFIAHAGLSPVLLFLQAMTLIEDSLCICWISNPILSKQSSRCSPAPTPSLPGCSLKYTRPFSASFHLPSQECYFVRWDRSLGGTIKKCHFTYQAAMPAVVVSDLSDLRSLRAVGIWSGSSAGPELARVWGLAWASLLTRQFAFMALWSFFFLLPPHF